jgi:thiamine biosynthesis protein ThiI
LISSGIDSPVAAWMMKEKGLEVIGLHMDNRPFTDARQISKTKRLCKIVGIKKLYISKHGLAMSDIVSKINRRFTCLVCRRMMFRTAERVAEKEGAKFIITGENLGQVASQTLDNLTVNDRATKLIILRPLLCYDKQEIVNISKKIGTYDISIEPPGCCRLVPINPATRSNIEQIKQEEENAKIDSISEEFEIEEV